MILDYLRWHELNAYLAQSNQGTCARKLLRPPAEPARLPYKPICGWQSALWEALAQSADHIAHFVNHPWSRKVPVHEIHVDGFSSQFVGIARTALYQEVMAMTPSGTTGIECRSPVLQKRWWSSGPEAARSVHAIELLARSMKQPCVTGVDQ